MKREKRRVGSDWAPLWDLDLWFLILAAHKLDLHKQLDKHLQARATHPFFLLPKGLRVAHQYVVLNTWGLQISWLNRAGAAPQHANAACTSLGSFHTGFIIHVYQTPAWARHHANDITFCWSPVKQSDTSLLQKGVRKVGLLLFYRRGLWNQNRLQNLWLFYHAQVNFADWWGGGGAGLWETSVSSSVLFWIGIYL